MSLVYTSPEINFSDSTFNYSIFIWNIPPPGPPPGPLGPPPVPIGPPPTQAKYAAVTGLVSGNQANSSFTIPSSVIDPKTNTTYNVAAIDGEDIFNGTEIETLTIEPGILFFGTQALANIGYSSTLTSLNFIGIPILTYNEPPARIYINGNNEVSDPDYIFSNSLSATASIEIPNYINPNDVNPNDVNSTTSNSYGYYIAQAIISDYSNITINNFHYPIASTTTGNASIVFPLG